MSYEIIWGDDFVELKYADNFTDSDILNSNKEVNNSEKIKHIQYQLCDLNHISKSSVTNAAITTVARIDTEISVINPNIKVAIITNKSVSFNISNMYKILSEKSKWETKNFDNRDEAIKWAQALK